VLALERHGFIPGREVLVTGAAGGVRRGLTVGRLSFANCL